MQIKTQKLFGPLILIMAALAVTTVIHAQERQMGGVGITIFSDQNFRGKSATFRQDVPDLEPLGLNDRASSLRVGPGEQWEVCEHSNYQGRCVVVSGNESDLRRNSWNDLISSLRRVGGGIPPTPPTGGSYIVLFDQTRYRGTPQNYDMAAPNLFGFNRRAQSVTIGSGVWELCEGRNFGGRCVTLNTSVPNLASYNLANRVSSVRPVDAVGPAPPAPPTDWYVVLYDRTTYRGNPTRYTTTETNVFKWARSVTIGRGTWELCQGRNFTGRCVTLNTSSPDLRANGISQVSSLRPILREPR